MLRCTAAAVSGTKGELNQEYPVINLAVLGLDAVRCAVCRRQETGHKHAGAALTNCSLHCGLSPACKHGLG